VLHATAEIQIRKLY